MCVYLCAYVYVCVQSAVEATRRHRQLWAATLECQEQNSMLLEEHYTLLSAEPSLQPTSILLASSDSSFSPGYDKTDNQSKFRREGFILADGLCDIIHNGGAGILH